MKKLLVLTLTLMMTFSLAACGDKSTTAPAASTEKEAPATTEAAAPAETEAAPVEAEEAAPVETEEAAPAETEGEALVYTLDYDTIASWVDSGFIGTDETGSPVVMAIDEANEMAIIIFGDNSDMTAASFVGAVTYTDTSGTITDEANESSLTFGINQIAEDTIELDMGDIGIATIKAASQEEVLETIKVAIENYEHIA